MTLRLYPLHGLGPDEQQICAVFADLVGSTRLAALLPTGHYAALMTEAIQLMMLSLETQGAALLPHQGDAVLGLWDADEVSQAACACQELHIRLGFLELARHLGLKLQLRIGCSVGAVILGELGGRPNAYGLPLNLARRLCSQAAPGETLVCAAAAGRTPKLLWQRRPLVGGAQNAVQGYRLGAVQGDLQAAQMKTS
jgi:adenylate cyclase